MTTSAGAAPAAELASLVQAEMQGWHVPGVAVGVLRDVRVESWGFGIASIEIGQPVTPSTLFQIGSITKVFTAMVVMQLVDEGLVDLDAPIHRYLPDFALADATAAGAVTLRHVLSHQAGFWGDNFTDFGPGDDALRRAVGEFPALRQLTAPGELWAYCNTGFQAAGAVIEAVLDTTVEGAIAERVFKPLGMERSVFFAHEAIVYPVAVGHNKLPGKDLAIARPYPLMRCMNAAGGIISTVGDLLSFAVFHLGDGSAPSPVPVPAGMEEHIAAPRLLSERSLRAMQEPQVAAGSFADHYGIGWALRTIAGMKVVGHGGSTNGFRAQLTLVPQRRVAVALLTNGSGGAALNRTVEGWALERYAGLRAPDPLPVPMTPAELARFAGRYQQPLADITVTVAGDGLRIEQVTTNPFNNTRVEVPPMQAVPIGPRRFLITDGEAAGSTIDFIPDDGDMPRFIRLHGRLADRKEPGS